MLFRLGKFLDSNFSFWIEHNMHNIQKEKSKSILWTGPCISSQTVTMSCHCRASFFQCLYQQVASKYLRLLMKKKTSVYLGG